MNPAKVLTLLSLTVVLGVSGTACAQKTSPANDARPAGAPGNGPALSVRLKPYSDGRNSVSHLDVTTVLTSLGVKKGQKLVTMPLRRASTPTVADGSGKDWLTARDEAGELPLEIQDAGESEFDRDRSWMATRDTQGKITVSYRAAPRALTAESKGGPEYGLQAENGGITGAGAGLLALPESSDTSYAISLTWDLSAMPPNSRGVWTYNAGDATTTGTVDKLADAYYAAGDVKEMRSGANGGFTFYYLSEITSFDLRGLTDFTAKLYDHASTFFRDKPGQVYSVFARQVPYRGLSGTALSRSFAFSFKNDTKLDDAELKQHLAHEMVHNWPRLDESQDDDGGWFTEGIANYYADVLPYRAGLIGYEPFVGQINSNLSQYYSNRYRESPRAEILEMTWKDQAAQRAPYHRGYVYLFRVDSQIKTASAGKRSLDDVVLELLRRSENHEKVDANTWLTLVSKEIGDLAQQEYRDMINGKLLIPLNEFVAKTHRVDKYRGTVEGLGERDFYRLVKK
ncbi:hypothetical protein [Amycolatopsis jejuensis]|uniref:M61 family metallopeptidase n=1 Tax=Amycolatopsis jejuensis TaxID=330084 RepID=UPI00052595E6|nr:hypothetical protein [Amycolatopsis jejuensis]